MSSSKVKDWYVESQKYPDKCLWVTYEGKQLYIDSIFLRYEIFTPAFIYTHKYGYVCMFVCICNIYILYVCTYVCMYVNNHVYMYVCIFVYIYSCMYVCMYKCMYVCMYICMYV